MKKEMKNDITKNEIYLRELKENGLMLRYIKKEDQTHEMCLTAVKEDGMALKYVDKQTPEICLAAIKQNYKSVEYVSLSKNDKFFIDAIKENPKVIKRIYHRNEEMILTAIKKDIKLLKHVYQTESICKKAVDYNIKAFKYCEYKPLDMCIKVVAQRPSYLKYIDDTKIRTITYNTIIKSCKKVKECTLFGDDEYCPILLEDGRVVIYDEKEEKIQYIDKARYYNPLKNIIEAELCDNTSLSNKYEIEHICYLPETLSYLAITKDNKLISNYYDGDIQLPKHLNITKGVAVSKKEGNNILYILTNDKVLYQYDVITKDKLSFNLCKTVTDVINIRCNEYMVLVETETSVLIYDSNTLEQTKTIDKSINDRFYIYDRDIYKTNGCELIRLGQLSNDNISVIKMDYPIEDVIITHSGIFILMKIDGVYKTYSYGCKYKKNKVKITSDSLYMIHDNKPKYLPTISDSWFVYLEDGIVNIYTKTLIFNM